MMIPARIFPPTGISDREKERVCSFFCFFFRLVGLEKKERTKKEFRVWWEEKDSATFVCTVDLVVCGTRFNLDRWINDWFFLIKRRKIKILRTYYTRVLTADGEFGLRSRLLLFFSVCNYFFFLNTNYLLICTHQVRNLHIIIYQYLF